MQDKEISTLVLTLEKDILKGYASAMTESSNQGLENNIHQLFDINLQVHRNLFDLMVANGWYMIEKVEEQQKTKEANKLSNSLQEMNNGQ